MSATRGDRCHGHGIAGYGNTASGLFLVGIAPGREESRTGVPMTGSSGKLIGEILKACNWYPQGAELHDKAYTTNIVCYETSKPTADETAACRARLDREVHTHKPKLAVLLGNPVTEVFFPERKPGNVRGAIQYYAPWDCYLLPTYHPAALMYGAGEQIARDIVRDFMKIPDFFSVPLNPDVTWTVCNTPLQLQRVLDNWPRDARISLDLEWAMKEEDSTSAADDTILYGSVSDGTNTYWFPGEFITDKQTGVSLPLDLQWGGFNFTSDSIAVYQARGILLPFHWDAIYMSYALDERGGQHGLKRNSREYLGAGFYEDYPDKLTFKRPKGMSDREATSAKWAERLKNISWGRPYNCKDSAYAARLADRFEPKVRADNMWGIYQFTLEAARVYRQMQTYGVHINMARFKELVDEYVPQLDTKSAALANIVAVNGGDPGINLGSPKQVSKFLFDVLGLPVGKRSEKTLEPSTGAEVLEGLEDIDESNFVVGLQDLRHLEKAVGTYLVGVYDYIKKTGRLHPSPLLHAQVSGRVAYNGPAINTTPKGYNENPYLNKLRRFYTASDDDHVIIEIDLKQAEVWMAWIYSQDPQMLADLRSGDFHRQSAAFINKVELAQVTDEQRSDAKRITFGKFFLIGADKLAMQSNREKRRDAYRTGQPFINPMSLREARTFIREWDTRYPMYGKYVEDAFKEAQETGELVSLTGRKRRYPIIMDDSIKTQIANWKIQSTAHDVLMSAIIKAHPVCLAMGANILIDVHDAMLIEAKKSNAMEVVKRVYDIVTGAHFDGVPPLPAEAKMGYSWLETKEIHI